MPHTPLLSMIADLARSLGGDGYPQVDRRTFLKAGAAAASTAALAAQSGRRVVIVGAGLAGLTCAYRLKQRGIDADIYDANSRAGGRCWSLRGAFDEGQIVERGGELIDQAHTQIRHLCQE